MSKRAGIIRGSGGNWRIMDDAVLQDKLAALQARLCELASVAVAFSGGVDSTLLLKVAHDVLGDSCVAVTGKSPSIPQRELDEAAAFCEREGVRHVIVETREFDIAGFEHNPPDRCYLCKREVFGKVGEVAAQLGAACVVEGSNVDDISDYRPGFKAVEELGVASPLQDAGLSKDEIRALSKRLGLKTWNKPSFACLNSRFEYGDLITPQKLEMVDAAEQILIDAGFAQVRVRMQATTARIEVPAEDIARFSDAALRANVVDALKKLGFMYVSVDLQGYRTGSMNETLHS